ncbi:MAG: ABC transporter ATP-binding protein, partial [Anaerolinea sp.]|nr:ABC transporter ATP-binding protein [Anaerolinea sp.]
MSDVVIRVENLGKRYRIGGKQESYKTLRESLTQAMTAPIRRIRAGRGDAPSETFWALKDVTFDVKRGEVLGVIGRNGAGKSTLLKILSKITEPTEGAVYLNGRVGSLLEVGTGFHPELTGRENIYLNGSILGMRRAEITKKLDEIIAFAEVEQFIDTPVKRYSSGMYTRLAFSVAAYLEPEIMIVDEVLAVGDAVFQKKCLGKMSQVAAQGRTVIFVSHNITAIRNLCNIGVLLNRGRVNSIGSIDGIISDYVNMYRTKKNATLRAQIEALTSDPVINITSISIKQNGEETLNPNNGAPIEIEVHY